MARLLIASLLMSSALLAACGSAPPPVPATEANTRNFMAEAMVAYNDNRYVEARSFFGRAYMQYHSVDDLQGQAHALIDLADSALLQGDVAAARVNLTDAHAVVDSQASLATLKSRLVLMDAYADLQSGDPAGAATRLDGLLAGTGVPADVQRAALFARTQAAFDAKATDAGLWLTKLGKPTADALDAARLERLQALAEPDATKAAALYTDALQRYQNAYYRPGIAATHEEWGARLLAQQDWSNARDHLQRALYVRLWMYDASRSAHILDELATADTALGDATSAKQDAQWAAYLKDGGDPSKSPVSPAPVGNPG
ncbi:MAG TPA: hypothetical protein VGO35_07475 [Gammaproteobacteria bacterium]|nr:hypothetical protein [Gammaproteobacteria bacterium]